MIRLIKSQVLFVVPFLMASLTLQPALMAQAGTQPVNTSTVPLREGDPLCRSFRTNRQPFNAHRRAHLTAAGLSIAALAVGVAAIIDNQVTVNRIRGEQGPPGPQGPVTPGPMAPVCIEITSASFNFKNDTTGPAQSFVAWTGTIIDPNGMVRGTTQTLSSGDVQEQAETITLDFSLNFPLGTWFIEWKVVAQSAPPNNFNKLGSVAIDFDPGTNPSLNVTAPVLAWTTGGTFMSPVSITSCQMAPPSGLLMGWGEPEDARPAYHDLLEEDAVMQCRNRLGLPGTRLVDFQYD